MAKDLSIDIRKKRLDALEFKLAEEKAMANQFEALYDESNKIIGMFIKNTKALEQYIQDQKKEDRRLDKEWDAVYKALIRQTEVVAKENDELREEMESMAWAHKKATSR